MEQYENTQENENSSMLISTKCGIEILEDSDSSNDEEEDLDRMIVEEGIPEDDEIDDVSATGIKSVHEITPEPPEISALPTINETQAIEEIGQVESVVEGIAVVKADTSKHILDAGSLLCLSTRRSIGFIEDVFGPVVQPFYTIRLSNELLSLPEITIRKGTPIFAASDMEIIAQPDRSKGSDASNVDDEEIADYEREFSDDEEEEKWKAQRKKEKLKLKEEKSSKQEKQSSSSFRLRQNRRESGHENVTLGNGDKFSRKKVDAPSPYSGYPFSQVTNSPMFYPAPMGYGPSQNQMMSNSGGSNGVMWMMPYPMAYPGPDKPHGDIMPSLPVGMAYGYPMNSYVMTQPPPQPGQMFNPSFQQPAPVAWGMMPQPAAPVVHSAQPSTSPSSSTSTSSSSSSSSQMTPADIFPGSALQASAITSTTSSSVSEQTSAPASSTISTSSALSSSPSSLSSTTMNASVEGVSCPNNSSTDLTNPSQSELNYQLFQDHPK
ncbi:putative H/ACA ribonucleoprotein complex non-core subunit [Monocercomonoides exilis]|uniref:putative H/ACA ribonucleoprotein complex non-core subunit n=1 Tax=Monocercomonoides exilis TaxID=2049356 RepID=UPI003559CEB4|nr:putative H/ACA ribonucleoprotein complex non-core subunit [Monocercomonoides exilis]|eukprot:MONOS_11097.1-p1 / transcript=MONOS_11097.1 / gene=MONOS_11097 / organism=Monocercomonoides_exilis_PA203 / gene_product=NAF1 domain containing protein / transcript_product=NAF1 domain containing protein / location=Mono_scaffold00538:7010-8536(-) / protein_length=492 / sequence_SO=supercontig / SO=protein_coding / is_pseudo=false